MSWDANDPELSSWVPGADGSGDPAQHLPYGVARANDEVTVVARIGDRALDLAALAARGLLPDINPTTLATGRLNDLLAPGPEAWASLRDRLSQLVVDRAHRPDTEAAMTAVGDLDLVLPVEIGDYVDFYSSLHHATNLGRLFRPGGDRLPANWRHLPMAYHGRSGTVVVSGTPVGRPVGLVGDGEGPPRRAPSAALDVELEVGFVVGARGSHIRPDQADQHVFGVVLVNDWSARDIQRFEYQPLGPFLGKSFATSMSAWVTPLDALRPFMVDPPEQEPQPDPVLRAVRPWGIDLDLSVELESTTIARTGFGDLYWTFAQQLAHMTSNGATTRPGDLFASGTVSGSEPGTFGSLIELTARGQDPLPLVDGTTRTFLQDGDEVVLRGLAGGGDRPRIELGEVRGTIRPAEEAN